MIRLGRIIGPLKEMEHEELVSDLFGIVTVSLIGTYIIIKNYIKGHID